MKVIIHEQTLLSDNQKHFRAIKKKVNHEKYIAVNLIGVPAFKCAK